MLSQLNQKLKRIRYKLLETTLCQFKVISHPGIDLASLMPKGGCHVKVETGVNKRIEVVSDTQIYVKIPCKDEFSPSKISVQYEDEHTEPSLEIMTSLVNPIPSVHNNSKIATNVKSTDMRD